MMILVMSVRSTFHLYIYGDSLLTVPHKKNQALKLTPRYIDLSGELMELYVCNLNNEY